MAFNWDEQEDAPGDGSSRPAAKPKPAGKTFDWDAAEDFRATPAAAAKPTPPATPHPGVGGLEAVARGAGENIPFYNPLMAAINAATDGESGGPGFMDRYRREREVELGHQAEAEKQHPALYKTGKYAEMVASAPMVGKNLATAAGVASTHAIGSGNEDLTNPTVNNIERALGRGAGAAAITYSGGKLLEAVSAPVARYIGGKVAAYRRSALDEAENAARAAAGDTSGGAPGETAPIPVAAGDGVESTAVRAGRKGGYQNELINRAQEARAKGLDKNNPEMAKQIDDILSGKAFRGEKTDADILGEIERGPRDTRVMRTSEIKDALEGVKPPPSPPPEKYDILIKHPQAGRVSGGTSSETVSGRVGANQTGLEDTAVRPRIMGEVAGSEPAPSRSFPSSLAPGRSFPSNPVNLPGESIPDYVRWIESQGPKVTKGPGDTFLNSETGLPLRGDSEEVSLLPNYMKESKSVGGMISGAADGARGSMLSPSVLKSAGLLAPLLLKYPASTAGALGTLYAGAAAKGAGRGLIDSVASADRAKMLMGLYRSVASKHATSNGLMSAASGHLLGGDASDSRHP